MSLWTIKERAPPLSNNLWFGGDPIDTSGPEWIKTTLGELMDKEKLLTLKDVLKLPPETRVAIQRDGVWSNDMDVKNLTKLYDTFTVEEVLADYRIVPDSASTPRTMPFECECVSSIGDTAILQYIADELLPFIGKRVRVTVEELP